MGESGHQRANRITGEESPRRCATETHIVGVQRHTSEFRHTIEGNDVVGQHRDVVDRDHEVGTAGKDSVTALGKRGEGLVQRVRRDDMHGPQS